MQRQLPTYVSLLFDRDTPNRVTISCTFQAIAAQLRGIIGFRLVIDRLEGKWKLSQNRTEADRQGVIGGLEGEGGALEKTIAREMKGEG